MRLLFILFALFLISCESKQTTTDTTTLQPIENIEGNQWFSNLLLTIDTIAGKRAQYMQMNNMETATYQSDTVSVDDIINAIEPTLIEAGYTRQNPIDLEKDMDAAHEQISAMKMKMDMSDHVTYKDANENVFTIMKMSVEHDINGEQQRLTMITVQLMNIEKMTSAFNNTNVE